MQITKIVLTGGPCSGKSTAMTWIQNTFTKMGYTVLFIPETATELITGGVAPWTCSSNFRFQVLLAQLQFEKELTYKSAAEGMNADKILIVCDRGIPDAQAFLSKEEYRRIAKTLGGAVSDIRDMYDAVFHLVTAANGAEEFYTLSNNAARTETPEEAREKDAECLDAWVGHPHLRVIDNSTNFDDKMKRLMAEIAAFLGEPEPYEIERKFLIQMPVLSELEAMHNCKKVEIIQTYLKSDEGEVRVRQRGADGNYTYVKTTKHVVSDVKRIETEKRISKNEYLDLLMDADTTKHQIRKTRYCLMYNNQYFEIDIYPFWSDKAIVEIELNDENTPIEFPPFLTIIEEVTANPAYKNARLAENLGIIC